ncbi:hypothetical protein THRCLA_20179 [Thraustotheca clavata]|uniref:Uncharacterized protein n=1 Tax=Thraustotheca clavata TaxID=74557 RepID=A0A1W0AAJ4_9STRA|nr:hypothetical protein THRCLA_20179 [Thraustotheca clavata]
MQSWDVIQDLHAEIFSILTEYLNNSLADEGKAEEIWKCSFQSEWVGDFDVLPKYPPAPSFRCVQTRRTYERCKKYFGKFKSGILREYQDEYHYIRVEDD